VCTPVTRLSAIAVSRKRNDKYRIGKYGGPVVTAGDLVFIAGTLYDRNVRVFDSKTGHLLWKADLPYAWQCDSTTYMIDGKQYAVFASSGVSDLNGHAGRGIRRVGVIVTSFHKE
jgi:glucose dehydrogenase